MNQNEKVRQPFYDFLIKKHQFKAETLDLLDYKNLEKLAIQYGYTGGVTYA